MSTRLEEAERALRELRELLKESWEYPNYPGPAEGLFSTQDAWLNEWHRLDVRVQAALAAAAARDGLPPLDTAAVLWLAAIDRNVPMEERIEWVDRMKLLVAKINTERAAQEQA